MNNPSSTYRIQFHKDFNFNDFERIIPYLIDLGIDTVYASPIFEAIPGSTHGYDVVNPHKLNAEIGTEKQLLAISKKLKKAGIKWLQDIVPNHMAFHPQNKMLMDVLEKGDKSKYAKFFDIDFEKGDGRLMVPFLGEDLKDSIENQNIILKKIKSKFFLSAGDSDWPVNQETAKILQKENINKRSAQPEFVKEIADAQHYRLCNWQETNSNINYRRFFTVNVLICVNIQYEEVFDDYHKYIFELFNKGVFQGFRIDHVDGLYDPKLYIDMLRTKVGEDTYLVVEKILEHGEEMPTDWRMEGNTGYDFLAISNNVFTNAEAESSFNKLYQNVIGKKLNPEELIYQKKSNILWKHMAGELNNLLELFNSLNLSPENEISTKDLKNGIGEFLIQMPVYRYYQYNFPLTSPHIEKLQNIVQKMIDKEATKDVGKLFNKIFIQEPESNASEANRKLNQFYQRCMQFTGPLMAKGVEDTLMFTYNRFVGHSEVGDAPHAFGLSIDQFHETMVYRQKNWPLSMNGSSTHDTKKGEDFRARLNVLTDIPQRWKELISKLQVSATEIQSRYPKLKKLHKNDIYLILQTVIGALPFPGEDSDDINLRLEQFIEKALREAKKRSNWENPDEKYEQNFKEFTQKLLDKKHTALQLINDFISSISDFTIINSLAQTTLKFMSPGVPDVYQGTELWDLSLVDPDNRRPVDYNLRKELLNSINENASVKSIWEERLSGKIKLWLTQILAKCRKSEKEIFDSGTYMPISVTGKYAEHILAFARQLNEKWIITVIPVGLAKVAEEQNLPVNKLNWNDTQIILPHDAPLEWLNLLHQKEGHKDILNNSILINQLFVELPIAIIKSIPKKNKRSAGILMHISSLPSKFGIGDMGSGAYNFVDFLRQSRQKYWQILPLNPTKAENGYSPYSSNSSTAGNILLISPEELLNDGLITAEELSATKIPVSNKIDFEKVEKLKFKLLKTAYLNYCETRPKNLQKAFTTFCKIEGDWLDSFAVYTAIRAHYQDLEWYNWPKQYKFRDEESLLDFEKTYKNEIEEIKWQQFIFFRQWHKLKNAANKNGIEIIGDLPFYLDYDSVEVWSTPENFILDEQLNKVLVAGVPPDYFNELGQLWGMPIFNWHYMKANKYAWWLNRLQKNMELFDLLRLDHFRAFASYWQVPAENTDAIHGSWEDGPGADFFNIMKSNIGQLPFIAEDLGETSEEAEAIIKKFSLPGMKVLQFGFGEHIGDSTHATHNFDTPDCIVYSGTHDNNTIKGWFKNETDSALHKRLSAYTGIQVNEKNINEIIIRLCYSSIAKLAILPIQDVLGLDSEARINMPGTNNDINWRWIVSAEALNKKVADKIKVMVEMYGRV
ncbi:malto-oligosyltrehalose synthase [Pedobacter lithocola]|uniref:4-alpha-glucanotransferase n=1 Tax=Pedobacter lithocola TaxID=1908239 RepID=A0ABV8P9G0_9SPHI